MNELYSGHINCSYLPVELSALTSPSFVYLNAIVCLHWPLLRKMASSLSQA